MPTDSPSTIENPRRIRSFVKRAGRMTPSQEHALENLQQLSLAVEHVVKNTFQCTKTQHYVFHFTAISHNSEPPDLPG